VAPVATAMSGSAVYRAAIDATTNATDKHETTNVHFCARDSSTRSPEAIRHLHISIRLVSIRYYQ